MKKAMFTLLIVLAGLTSANAQTSEDPKGKSIFKENKCVGCHAIETQGFLKKGKSSAPDLSNVGNKLTIDFLKKYLKKEEVQNDLKHPVSFKGNDEDFAVLTDWLAALKKQEAADTLKSK
ncbi:MAG: c-type cytochrome [Ignavibacteriales bacterium]|nr:c-type cytochrome [Ignavibacteriales bacterium]